MQFETIEDVINAVRKYMLYYNYERQKMYIKKVNQHHVSSLFSSISFSIITIALV